MTRREQRIGKHGQTLAASTLSALGVECIESIGTPVRLIPHPAGREVFRVIWGERVAADHHGLLNGRGVLVETKTILDRNLRYSDFREHQPEKLRIWGDAGGLALVVWVHNSGVYVLRFPIDGFGYRESITPQRAAELDAMTRKELTCLTFSSAGR